MMNAELPKIWNTTFPDETGNGRNIDFHLPDNRLEHRVALGTAAKYPDGKPLSPGLVPDYIFFSLKDLREDYRAKTPDWFRVMGGVHVVSEKFRNFLTGFDLGATQFFEVPLYEFDQKTRRPGRWFVFNIRETKDTLVAEQSTGLKQRGMTVGLWRSHVGEDVLAVRASAAKGVDLWIDLHMLGRIFLSDRLKSSLKGAGIKVLKMPLRPCIVIP
jgi:hypothetical protein